MKKLKTLISVMLCAMLVLSLVVPSMADSTYSVTVNNAIPGETYKLYQIFDFEPIAGSNDKGVYTVKGDVYDLLKDKTSDETGVTLDTTKNHENEYYVKSVDDEVKFSKFLHNNVASLGEPVDTQTAPTDKTVTFENVTNNGYYFVDTTAGSLFILDTTTPSISVDDKNESVTVDKKVSDSSEGGWGMSNNAQIGDIVYFQITVTIPKGSKNVVVHDTMEAGLTITNDSVKAFVGDTAVTTSNYSVTYNPTDGCTFEVAFTEDYLNSLTADSTDVIVFYNATLNENATVNEDTNDNQVKVKFGDNSWTQPSTTYTKTLSFSITKNDGKNTETTTDDSKITTSDAEFKLYKKIGNNYTQVPVAFVASNLYRVDSTASVDIVIKAGKTGVPTIEGLDFDTDYYILETKAPEGYNRLNDYLEIGKNSSTTLLSDRIVINNSGTELPSTGGMGTKILFTVGGIMMVVAFVLFTSKRRMAAED